MRVHLIVSRKAAVQRVLAAITLWALNAWLCWPLFQIEYLDQFQSNEGSFITFAAFLQKNWPHVRWFPLFNCGVPYEATYLPLAPVLTALGSWLAGCSPALAFHFLAAMAYSLAPVSLFFFALTVSDRAKPSFAAALLWSLFSPSVLIASVRADVGGVVGLRRLQTVVFYGEVPHNLAICLAPLALIAVYRYLERATARRFAAATLAVAAVALSNAFGIVLIGVSSAILAAVYDRESWKRLPAVGALLLASYLLICRLLPPSVLGVIHSNSQLVGGDFRFTTQTYLLGVGFAMFLAAMSRLVLRLANPMLRFSSLFLIFFGGITLLATRDIFFLPQPQRYHLEMEVGICMVAAFGFTSLRWDLVPRNARLGLAAISCVGLVWVAAVDRQYARRLVRPADVAGQVLVRQARWIGSHLPGQRVMASGEAGFWFNNFAGNPLLGGGHEPTAPNWVQRVAVYTIYSGQNAGDRDGPISVLWLKAFGCRAVTVPGPRSDDNYRPFRNPQKFDGLLPLVWREADQSVYQVPLRSLSLAHTIPSSAVVTRRPIHGLDTADVAAYVAALDDDSIPAASLTWQNPEQGRIVADMAPGQVVSVQIGYDPGWQASMDGHRLPVFADQLGMVVIAPGRSGPCHIDLRFTDGPEREACSIISCVMAVVSIGMLAVKARRRAAALENNTAPGKPAARH
jgi:hypothetical protein